MKRGTPIFYISLLLIVLVIVGFSPDFFEGKSITGNVITTDCTNVAALYHFENNANDDSGNSNHGTCYGGICPTFVSGKTGLGSAYSFDGTGKSILIPDHSTINPLSWTIGGWVKYTGATSRLATGTFIAKSDSTNRDYLLSVNNLDGFCQYRTGSAVTVTGPVDSIAKNTWTHLMCSYDRSNNKLSLYINGVLVNSTLGSFAAPDNNFDLSIGGRTEDAGIQGFIGEIDEVIIYNRVLSSSEVTQLYNSGNGVSVSCGTCVPNCGLNVCGNDGCGGSCGSCSGTDVCSSGACVPQASCTDIDGDGYGVGCSTGNDCNDTNASIHPGATEVCDGVDNDCDGQIDENCGIGIPITINASQKYQVIDGFGVSEAWNFPNSTFYPALFDDLGISILRFRLRPELEANNDNNDPFIIDWTNVNLNALSDDWTIGGERDYITLLQEAKSRGIPILATVWSPPAWMKTNNDVTHGGKVIVGYEDEFAEYIVIWLKALRDYYGIDVDYLSIQNEPDVNEVWETCLYSGSEIRDMIKVVGSRLALEGLNVKLYSPDIGWPNGFNSRVDPICNDPVAKNYLETLTTHTYGSGFSTPDGFIPIWQSVKSTADSCGKKLWMTEFSRPSQGNQENFWSDGILMAQHIHNALYYGHVSAYISWEFFDSPQPIINKAALKFHRFNTQRQYFKFIRPGAVRIDTQSGDNDILVTAFNNNNNLTIVVINRKLNSENVNFNLNGLSGLNTLNVVRTTQNEASMDLGNVQVSGNSFSYNLPGESVTTFVSSSIQQTYQCNNSIDDDGDTLIDFPADLGCSSPTDNNETDIVVILSPFHPADLDNSSCVNQTELNNYFGLWFIGTSGVSIESVGSAIESWQTGCGLTCTPDSNAVTCGTDVCGIKINNCGSSVSCGTCTGTDVCSSGSCVAQAVCGDGSCDSGESCSSCDLDCGSCVVGAPYLQFSDITSGPSTGNSDPNGDGAIVTIWGNNLGNAQDEIYFKDSTGASYLASYVYYWKNADGQLPGGPADLYSSHKMQEIALAIPSSAAQGLGEIYTKVNGVQSNSLPFTVRSGNIYFVKTTGSDTAGDGSWGNPYQKINRLTYDSKSNIQAGDIIYAVGTFTESQDSDGLAIRETRDGTLTSPISAIVYPNSKVTLYATRYGIKNYYSDADFWNFAKFDVQSNANGIESFREGRIVGNKITDRELDMGASGCATGAGGAIAGSRRNNGNMGPSGAIILGNYIHDFGCDSSSGLHHVFYISNRNGTSVKSYELGWNHLKDNKVSNGLHVYDTDDCGGWTGPMNIHDNFVINQREKGLSIGGGGSCAAGFTMPINVYNNIFVNTGIGPNFLSGGMAAFAIDIKGEVASHVNFYHNTIYGYSDPTLSQSITKRALNFVHIGTYNWQNNLVVDTRDLPYIASYQPKFPSQSGNNLWYNGGDSTPFSPPLWDSGALTSDPQFTDIPNNDFTLQGDSPARDAGTNVGITRDIYGNLRDSNNPSIGAAEYVP